jgi:hypothetical protein
MILAYRRKHNGIAAMTMVALSLVKCKGSRHRDHEQTHYPAVSAASTRKRQGKLVARASRAVTYRAVAHEA